MAQKNPFQKAAERPQQAQSNQDMKRPLPADKPRTHEILPRKMAPISMTYFDWLMKGKM